jgi:hypothetical protein
LRRRKGIQNSEKRQTKCLEIAMNQNGKRFAIKRNFFTIAYSICPWSLSAFLGNFFKGFFAFSEIICIFAIKR